MIITTTIIIIIIIIIQVCFQLMSMGMTVMIDPFACVAGGLRQHAMLQLRGKHLSRQAVSGVHRVAKGKLRPWQRTGQRSSKKSGNVKECDKDMNGGRMIMGGGGIFNI